MFIPHFDTALQPCCPAQYLVQRRRPTVQRGRPAKRKKWDQRQRELEEKRGAAPLRLTRASIKAEEDQQDAMDALDALAGDISVMTTSACYGTLDRLAVHQK